MTENQILILGFVGFWIFASILTYILLLRYTRKEYKKFYPHPIVNIVKDLNSDSRFKFWDKLFIFTGLNIVYLPIICEWLIAWCLYKFWKFIYVDDTIEQKIEEEIREQSINTVKEEENIEQDKASLHAEQMEKDLENIEYINKEEKSDDYFRSQEFLNYLHDKNNQDSKVVAYDIDLAQISEAEINKIEAVKNISNVDNEDKPKVEQEIKPKRKYNKKNKVENNDDNNETKNN